MSQLNSLLESAAQGWKNLQSDAAKLASSGIRQVYWKVLVARLTKTICQ
jgi:hypothetical protein